MRTQNETRGYWAKCMQLVQCVPTYMGRKSCLYAILEYCVQARLSAHTDWISCFYLAQYPRLPCCGVIYALEPPYKDVLVFKRTSHCRMWTWKCSRRPWDPPPPPPGLLGWSAGSPLLQSRVFKGKVSQDCWLSLKPRPQLYSLK